MLSPSTLVPMPLNCCPAEVCCQALLQKANTKSMQTFPSITSPAQDVKPTTGSENPLLDLGWLQIRPWTRKEQGTNITNRFSCAFSMPPTSMTLQKCHEMSPQTRCRLSFASCGAIEGHQTQLRMQKCSSSAHVTHHRGFAPMFPHSHSTKPRRCFNQLKSDTCKTDIKHYIQ